MEINLQGRLVLEVVLGAMDVLDCAEADLYKWIDQRFQFAFLSIVVFLSMRVTGPG